MLILAAFVMQTVGLPGPMPYSLESRTAVKLRTWAEHDAIVGDRKTPYVVKIPNGIVFGFHPHSNNPGDPQFTELEREWSGLRPSVILVEGRPGPYFGKESDLVARIGETGWAMRRAQVEKLKIWSWEPSIEAEVAALLKHGSKEDAALMLFLRTYVSRRRSGPVSDSDASSVLTRRLSAYGLAGTFEGLPAMESYWKSKFSKRGDWREVPEGWKWAGEDSVFFKMSGEVGDLRTSNLVRCVQELIAKGERVLAVCGSGHAIRGEKGLSILDFWFLDS